VWRHETQSLFLVIFRQAVEKFLTSDGTSETTISLSETSLKYLPLEIMWIWWRCSKGQLLLSESQIQSVLNNENVWLGRSFLWHGICNKTYGTLDSTATHKKNSRQIHLGDILNGREDRPSVLYYRHVEWFHISEQGHRIALPHCSYTIRHPTAYKSNLSVFIEPFIHVHHTIHIFVYVFTSLSVHL
jgi:hypothetical protein